MVAAGWKNPEPDPEGLNEGEFSKCVFLLTVLFREANKQNNEQDEARQKKNGKNRGKRPSPAPMMSLNNCTTSLDAPSLPPTAVIDSVGHRRKRKKRQEEKSKGTKSKAI